MNNDQKISRFRVFLPEIFVSLAVSFLLIVYGPVEVFYNNSGELSYNIKDVLLFMLPLFLLILLFLLCIFFIIRQISQKLEFYILLLAFSGLIFLYLQGNIFTAKLPPLDGREIQWQEYGSENIKGLLLFLILVAAVFLLFFLLGKEKTKNIIKVIALLLFFVLLLTGIMYCAQCFDGIAGKEIYCTNEKILEMSEDSNLIIFLADQVDAEAFKEVMSVHEEYQDILEDFTFFENTMSGYAWTLRSIPFILSGQWFENEQPYWEYTPQAMNTSPLFAYLENNHYRMGFYGPYGEYTYAIKDLPFENLAEKNEHFTYPDKFIKMQIKLSGYRYLPYFLKPLCYLSADDLYLDALKTDEHSIHYIVNSDFYKSVSDMDVSKTEDKCFKFIYILGAHAPFDYPAESESVEDYSYLSSIENTVSTFQLYLKKLKEAGVYDNTAILFMADHGYAPEYQNGFGRQNPVFLVKGIREKHPFQISDSPVSHVDLIDKYPALAEGEESTAVFSYPDNNRARRYLLYAFGEENIMHEYYQYGFASDEETMVATGKVYSR